MLSSIELGTIDPGSRCKQLATTAQHGIAELENSQVWPRLGADAKHFLEDAIGRHLRRSLGKDQCDRCGGAGHTGMAVHEQMRVRPLLGHKLTPEAENIRHMFGLWHDRSAGLRLDDIMEAKLELCVLTVGAKRLRNRP